MFLGEFIIECMWKIVLDYEFGYIKGFVLIIYLVCMIDGVYELIIYNDRLSYVEVKLIIYLKKIIKD